MGEFFAIDSLITGLLTVFQPHQLMWLSFGVAFGIFGGMLPGISGATMLSIMLVFATRVPLDSMVIAMAGIYAAATYSGTTAGILYNVPGEAPSIPATIEGYSLTKQGKSMQALVASLSASFYGATFSFIMMLIMVPLFLYLVTFIGTGERAMFALWALVIITGGALTKDDFFRGIASMAIGLFIGTIGMQRNIGAIRYVGGISALWDGFNLLWIILGVFAIPQLVKLPYIKVQAQEAVKIKMLPFLAECFRTIRKHNKLLLVSSICGTIVGIIPGIGTVAASWLGYSQAERMSKTPETFGKGNVEGILGAESANNACVPGTFVPLLALGIPGSAANAIIFGAFMSAGIYPGPALMQTNGPVVWTILFGIGLSGFVFLLLGVPFIKMAQFMAVMPSEFLIAFIGILTLLGTYLSMFSVFGSLMTIGIGLVMMFGSKFGLLPSNLLLGFILGPVIEVEFIRAFQIGGFARFLRPVSLAILILILLTLIWGFMNSYRNKKAAENNKNKLMSDEESTSNYLGDLVFGVSGLLLALYMYMSLRDIQFLGRLWPLIIIAVFISIPCAFLILRALINRGEVKSAFVADISALPGLLTSKTTLDFVVIIGGLIFSALMIDVLGFVGASGVFAALVLGFFGRKWSKFVFGTVAFMLFIWIIRTSLNFPLPRGFLGL